MVEVAGRNGMVGEGNYDSVHRPAFRFMNRDGKSRLHWKVSSEADPGWMEAIASIDGGFIRIKATGSGGVNRKQSLMPGSRRKRKRQGSQGSFCLVRKIVTQRNEDIHSNGLLGHSDDIPRFCTGESVLEVLLRLSIKFEGVEGDASGIH
jgi:hypothetical protein